MFIFLVFNVLGALYCYLLSLIIFMLYHFFSWMGSWIAWACCCGVGKYSQM